MIFMIYIIFCNTVIFLEGMKLPVQVMSNAVKITIGDDNQIH